MSDIDDGGQAMNKKRHTELTRLTGLLKNTANKMVSCSNALERCGYHDKGAEMRGASVMAQEWLDNVWEIINEANKEPTP